jgi:hypothetical protein
MEIKRIDNCVGFSEFLVPEKSVVELDGCLAGPYRL